MPEYNIKQIVDAIAADIAATVTLPTHRVHLYTKARSLRLDEVANWLQIYPSKTVNRLVSTGSEYYDHEEIVVAWVTETFDEMSYNDGNPDKAAQHLEYVMAIQERLNEWGDGVPGLFNVGCSMVETRYDNDDGPAWIAEIEIDIEIFRG